MGCGACCSPRAPELSAASPLRRLQPRSEARLTRASGRALRLRRGHGSDGGTRGDAATDRRRRRRFLYLVRPAAISRRRAGALLGLSLPSRPLQVNHVLTRSGVARSGDVFALLDRIDANPRAVLGRKETVSGQWSPGDARRPPTVSRHVMTCCAADSIDIGFDVYELYRCPIARGALVRVTGLVDALVRNGELRYGLVRARVTAIRENGSSRCVATARRPNPAALRARRQRGQEPIPSATRGGSRPAGR
jgi:hypothetical protein